MKKGKGVDLHSCGNEWSLLRLKAKETARKCCSPGDKGVCHRVLILKPLNLSTYTGTEQLSKQMRGSQFPQCLKQEVTGNQGEKARMIHVEMD